MKIFQTLGGRIFAIFVAVTLPLALILLSFSFYGLHMMRVEVSKSTGDLLDVYATQIEKKAMEMTDYLRRMALENQDILELGLLSDDENVYREKKERVLHQLDHDRNLLPGVAALFVFEPQRNDIGLVSGDTSYQYACNTAGEYLKDYKASNGAKNMQWNLVKSENRYFLVNVFDGGMGAYVGALVDLKVVLNPLESMTLGESGHVLVTSGEEVFYVSKDIGVEPDFYQDARKKLGEENYTMVKNGSMKFLCIKKEIPALRFSMFTFIEEGSVLRYLPYFQLVLYLILVIVVLLYAVFLRVSDRTIIRPTRQMIESLEKQKGDAVAPIGEQYSIREFNELTGTVNRFIQQIGSLKNTVLEEKVKVQQAELKRLQAQINPHFYINTLNMIYHLVAMGDRETAQKLVLHLGNYLQFIMRNNRTEITLSDELEHIKNYLEIQIVRFPEEISYSFELSPKLLGLMLPPLCVQPFVENCVVHGLDQKGSRFQILVEGDVFTENHQEFARICIRDNGGGMPQTLMDTLNHVNEADHTFLEQHIGVWNVVRRLELSFGDKASVVFSKNCPKGTTVTIMIPCEREKLGHKDTEEKGHE